MRYIFLITLLCSINSFAMTEDEASQCQYSFPEDKISWMGEQSEKALDGEITLEYQVLTSLLNKLNVTLASSLDEHSDCSSLENYHSSKVKDAFEIIEKIEKF